MEKTEDTKEKYIHKAKQLMIKAYNETLQKNDSFSEKNVVINYKEKDVIALSILHTGIWASKNWAINLMQSTWKLYRSALIYYAETEFEREEITAKQLEKFKEILKKTSGSSDKKTGRTSNSKKKSFNLIEMKEIDAELKNNKSKWANATRIFIRAGKYVGLRPIEWIGANYNEEKKILIVLNAKNTNGRSFGNKRILSLEHLDENQIKDVVLQVSIVKGIYEKGLWNIYYEGCSSLLRRIARKIWPNKKKYPTLYSSRHQFSADMKASGCTMKEVAALMGHASDQTAQSHYGKRIYGTRGRKPKVNKNDLIKIKVKNIKTFKFDKKKS